MRCATGACSTHVVTAPWPQTKRVLAFLHFLGPKFRSRRHGKLVLDVGRGSIFIAGQRGSGAEANKLRNTLSRAYLAWRSTLKRRLCRRILAPHWDAERSVCGCAVVPAGRGVSFFYPYPLDTPERLSAHQDLEISIEKGTIFAVDRASGCRCQQFSQ